MKNSRSTNLFIQARFILFHVVFIVSAFMVPLKFSAAILGIALYFIRMFGVTGGYHRYFSHRAFKTSRAFAFTLACIAQSSAQRGAIWWASNHRHHHRYSDKEEDLHSPDQHGLFYAHVGWLWNERSYQERQNVEDLKRCPELVFLNNYPMLPAIALGVLTWLTLGWSGLVHGFGISTIFLFHGTFTINSLTHVWGSRRYDTSDSSRNNLWLALITLGEGWHNNHHRYMRSARQGFFWWEIDITFYVLWILEKIGLVWELKKVPEEVLQEKM